MADERKDGGQACAWCSEPAHIQQGRILLCLKHYRMSSMRANARRYNKITPTLDELESLIPDPFVCIGCNRVMSWGRANGASRQATLQHDRSGKLRILCLACNTRHARHPGDTFYSISPDEKWCAGCSQVLPKTAFFRDRSRPCGLKGNCRECSKKAHTNWRVNNAAHYNAKQRERRAATARQKGGDA